MTSPLRTLAAAMLVLLGPAYLFAQSTQKPRPGPAGRGGTAPITLNVQVTDPAGKPVEDVQVAVSGPVDRSGTTDTGGSTGFRTMKPGTYRLRFERDGFTILEREVVLRAGAAADVSVTLTPAPAAEPKPEPPSAAADKPASPPPSSVVADPRTLSIPDFLERNLIGGEPQKTTLLGCAEGGTARLLQIRDPLPDQQHSGVDEFLYVVAGSGTLRIRNYEDTRLQPGHYAMIPRGVPHSLRREGRNPIILLSILAGAPCTANPSGGQ